MQQLEEKRHIGWGSLEEKKEWISIYSTEKIYNIGAYDIVWIVQ